MPKIIGNLKEKLMTEPLRKFCKSDAEAQIIAEALLAWIRTGKSFEEVYGSIMKLF